MKYLKILGRENPADLYTKFLDNATSDGHIKRLEYNVPKDKSTEAPRLHMVRQSIDECNYGNKHEYCEWIQTLLT